MAETAMYLALRKIRTITRASGQAGPNDDVSILEFDVLFPQTSVVELGSRLMRIETELGMMHCFLGQMETRYNNNRVLVNWIEEAQKLARLVEEIVDKCTPLFYEKPPVWRTAVHIFLSHIGKVQILAQLSELELDLEHLSKLKKRWAPVDNGHPSRPADHDKKMQLVDRLRQYVEGSNCLSRMKTYLFSKKHVGFDEQKKELVRRLRHSGGEPVVAVCGPGGSGKTTLVRSAYEEDRRYFHCHAWISMSGCSSADAILIKMRQELRLKGDTAIAGRDTVEHSLEQLRLYGISNKKFFIVFDDVHVQFDDVHVQLMDGLLRKMSSRIVIITRFEQCATPVGLNTVMIDGLNKDEAFGLFCTAASWEMSEITTKMTDLITKIIGVCMDLPQLIISVGASLSSKPQTLITLKQIWEQLEWVKEHNKSLNDTEKCLYVSYNNLPMHLKTCLLYCSIFPAGHLLLGEKLVRLWVAEGFIEKQRASELEENIAKGCLQELIRWGFLQRVDSDELGGVGSCRMPIAVHELVQSISTKEGFGIASEDAELPQTETNARCLFISKHHQRFEPLTDFPHLRTLLVGERAAAASPHYENRMARKYSFSRRISKIVESEITQKKIRYLTVLDLHGSYFRELKDFIGDLFNLRYLGLSKTQVKSLPESFRRLYNIQTLDIRSTRIEKLPSWIGSLTRLRHLLADYLDSESKQLGVKAPKSVKKLKQLQTLETVQASASLVKILVMLTNFRSRSPEIEKPMLRSLCISNVESKSCRTLFELVSKLCSLSSLSIGARDEKQVLYLEFLSPQKLEKLVITGAKLDDHLKLGCAEQLKSLELSCCTLGKDSSTGWVLTKNIEFQRGRFIELRRLVLQEIGGVEKLIIPMDALGKLEILHVESLRNLMTPVKDRQKFLSVKDLYFPQLNVAVEETEADRSSSSLGQSQCIIA